MLHIITIDQGGSPFGTSLILFGSVSSLGCSARFSVMQPQRRLTPLERPTSSRSTQPSPVSPTTPLPSNRTTLEESGLGLFAHSSNSIGEEGLLYSQHRPRPTSLDAAQWLLLGALRVYRSRVNLKGSRTAHVWRFVRNSKKTEKHVIGALALQSGTVWCCSERVDGTGTDCVD